MKRRIRKVLAVLGVLVAAGVAWMMRPYEKPDPAKVHPRLSSLKEPFQAVKLRYAADGGSLGVTIIDAGGVEVSLAVPVWADGKEYGAIYLDTLCHDERTPGVKIDEPGPTAIWLQDVIRRSDPPAALKDFIVGRWSGRDRDKWRMVSRKLTGFYPDERSGEGAE